MIGRIMIGQIMITNYDRLNYARENSDKPNGVFRSKHNLAEEDLVCNASYLGENNCVDP